MWGGGGEAELNYSLCELKYGAVAHAAAFSSPNINLISNTLAYNTEDSLVPTQSRSGVHHAGSFKKLGNNPQCGPSGFVQDLFKV